MFIRDLAGDTYKVKVRNGTKIRDIKKQIKNLIKKQKYDLELVWGGEKLADDRTVDNAADYSGHYKDGVQIPRVLNLLRDGSPHLIKTRRSPSGRSTRKKKSAKDRSSRKLEKRRRTKGQEGTPAKR